MDLRMSSLPISSSRYTNANNWIWMKVFVWTHLVICSYNSVSYLCVRQCIVLSHVINAVHSYIINYYKCIFSFFSFCLWFFLKYLNIRWVLTFHCLQSILMALPDYCNFLGNDKNTPFRNHNMRNDKVVLIILLSVLLCYYC